MSDKVVTLLVELEQNCKNASRLCLSQIETLEKDIGYIQFYAPESVPKALEAFKDFLHTYDQNKSIESQAKNALRIFSGKQSKLTSEDIQRAYQVLEESTKEQTESNANDSNSVPKLTYSSQQRLKIFENAIRDSNPDLVAEEEIHLETTKRTHMCPLWHSQIKIAFKSKICSHIFEKDAIVEYINQQKMRQRQVTCPISGCTNQNTLKLEDFVEINLQVDQGSKDGAQNKFDLLPIEIDG